VLVLTTDKELSDGLTRYLWRLRYRLKDVEYLAVNEWAGGHRHIHALVRTGGELTPGLVGDLWGKSLPGLSFTHHCGPVRDSVAVARYLVKDIKDGSKKEVPPQSFRGRLLRYSKGFFSAKVADLWREQIAEWYPERGAI
jgi:hypothetical protein